VQGSERLADDAQRFHPLYWADGRGGPRLQRYGFTSFV
jgi:hypothetical protein